MKQVSTQGTCSYYIIMNCGIKRILQFSEAVNYGPIQVFDCNGADITNQCMYSWSNDLVCWTTWTDYAHYLSICENIEEDFYLRILLFGSFEKVSINNLFTTCYSICMDQTNPFLETFCDNENLFKPYQNLDCALLLQQQLADSIVCMFGIPVYYFRVKPDADTADYTFKEYVLHNVVDVKQINIVIQDGQMPSSNPKFTALDFDWQNDWEVEVGKTEFARAFGDTAFPKIRDFIYVPMMKRMYDVNAAYDEKNEGLMWRPTTWKLSLIKYEDSTNVNIPDEINSLVDTLIVNKYDDVFGKKERAEQDRVTGAAPITSPQYAATNLFDISMQDAVRHKYSKDEVSIIDYQYNHHANVVARTIYKFKTPTATVTYQNGYCGADGTLSFILQTQGMPTEGQNIINMGPIQIKMVYDANRKNSKGEKGIYTMHFNGMSADIDPFSTQLVIVRWNKQTYTVSMEAYRYTHQEGVPPYMLKPEMYWFEEDPIFSQTSPYNLDFEVGEKQPCYIQPYPCMVTNIKLYNKDLGQEDSIRESIKYVTQHPACVINDLARHISSGHGYAVR